MASPAPSLRKFLKDATALEVFPLAGLVTSSASSPCSAFVNNHSEIVPGIRMPRRAMGSSRRGWSPSVLATIANPDTLRALSVLVAPYRRVFVALVAMSSRANQLAHAVLVFCVSNGFQMRWINARRVVTLRAMVYLQPIRDWAYPKLVGVSVSNPLCPTPVALHREVSIARRFLTAKPQPARLRPAALIDHVSESTGFSAAHWAMKCRTSHITQFTTGGFHCGM